MEIILILPRDHDSVARKRCDVPASYNDGCACYRGVWGDRWRVHQGVFGAWQQPFSVTFDFDLEVQLILISFSSCVHASPSSRARHTWLCDVYDLS